ncbi:uncharacterized protein Z518_05920 [Rhinocladiella mackenziei CBS 650.93]|uniref:KOW domain-containing protein n=1 Tax=Rhinocladiella mackenziei CBS 650.93 TaxID=1442369 RepID=A0A0D2H3T5_9EURO|nr:uncharacterized protein Z518_05920 [Rhinocladiella mackenziei CBS 650.93]KIX05048.1 hypothetical protein Z518_05920 [Rhinocladiella mackenziei CBS 650.93]
MQKILRINLLSRNQALKATRRKELKKLKQDWSEFEQRRIAVEKTNRESIKTERKHRREDWIAGPLAPKHDVGEKAELYGTVDTSLLQTGKYPEPLRRGPKGNGWDPVGSEGLEEEQKEWEGEGNEGNIVEGDRVCVVYGKEDLIGRIGRVKNVDLEAKELTIERLNMADVEFPKGTPGRDRIKFQGMELPIPISHVRLVHRLTDEETGRDRDVIVQYIRGGAPYFQREAHSPLPRHTRYIAGEDIEIPWPEPEIPSYQAWPSDTSRFEVEHQSFMPSLYYPPLPHPEILNELRNDKYARDREWHEAEYTRMKILEDARAAWYQQRKLQSPKEQLREQRIKDASQKTKEIKERGMSDETIRIIRELQMSKKSRTAKTLAA